VTCSRWWFSPVSSTNKTDHHDITEILLKVALNTIKPNHRINFSISIFRILIVDWDIHHGNAMQTLFYDDSRYSVYLRI
jgi:hypothetical protein